MALTLKHIGDDAIELRHDDLALFRYEYRPTFDPWEGLKPYLHPVRTFAGDVVTIYRPHDHLWHKGFQMTCAHLSLGKDPGGVGQNFWGGNSYVRGKGYSKIDNVGMQRHDGWDEAPAAGDGTMSLKERLTWIASDQKNWVEERRQISLADYNPKEGFWSLDWNIVLKNVAGDVLWFGSPTTEGRELAGYGGLFWRGPREWLNGKILAGNNLDGPGVMGQRAPWLAYSGAHDGSANHSTLLFVDRPGNPSYPNKWFVRNDPFAAASFAFSFDEYVRLDPGKEMALNHRTVIANGQWSRNRIEKYLRDAGLHD